MVFIHTYIYIYIYIYVLICLCLSLSLYIYVHTYTHIYIYIYIYPCKCVCVCACIHIYTYTYIYRIYIYIYLFIMNTYVQLVQPLAGPGAAFEPSRGRYTPLQCPKSMDYAHPADPADLALREPEHGLREGARKIYPDGYLPAGAAGDDPCALAQQYRDGALDLDDFVHALSGVEWGVCEWGSCQYATALAMFRALQRLRQAGLDPTETMGWGGSRS
jgi:hypothetical protein